MRTSNAFCPIPTARWLACALLLIGLCAGTAQAQLQTGNLYGEVADAEGARLPGVTVTIRGNGAPQFQLTDASGAFRFLGLSPGTYQLTAELEGFSTVDYPSISITTGRSTTIEVTLTAALEDVITVTSESPLLDQRKITTGTSVSQVELEKIPTARDPWVILQQTPGVLVDRVNVGGNESGQQSAYISPGTSADNGVWAVDGVVITDMGAIGSSPSYYNFDAFEEMQVTTGGTDVSLATGGVTMNMVTKRGTNEWRASGRYLWTDESTQSSLDFDQDDLGAGQNDFEQGNQIVDVLDYGADAGGPLVKDRLWIWGTYGVQEIDLLTLDDVSDFTELESYAVVVERDRRVARGQLGVQLGGVA
ncbi:MAG: TonB-dependent receptor, partial [Acidobacteriota bacterium]